MEKEPITINGLEKLKDELIFLKEKKRPEIVILEGWCVGAKPQSNKLIKKPVNILEKNEDKNLKWRKNVNKNLKKKYKKVFQMIDQFIFIKVPNFDMVFKWRILQEKKLKKKVALKSKSNVLQRNKAFYYVLRKNYFANVERFK